MTERMVYGCHVCLCIFSPDFIYVDEDRELEDDMLRCPSCGSYTLDLGYAPCVTMKEEGLWYLCDEQNIMGPYPSEEEASADLWSWFGGRPHAQEGRKESHQEGDQTQSPRQDCPQ